MDDESGILTFVVSADESGERLDRVLAARIGARSRSFLGGLVRQGLVRVEGEPAPKPGFVVEEGASIRVEMPPEQDERLEPEDIPLTILHEDDALIVLDKAADMVVHPGAGIPGGTLASALLHHAPTLAGVGGEGRAGLVHRLDRGTTGAMVVAKTHEAHAHLQAQFQQRSVEKRYRAFTWGRPKESSGRIDLPIGRDPRNRVRMATSVPGARPALSEWSVLEEIPGFAQLEVQIHTGRTHQVRVHLKAIGYPIVGDLEYAGDRAKSVNDPQRRALLKRFTRPALHAETLSFDHPTSGERLEFRVPLPRDMRELWTALGGTRL